MKTLLILGAGASKPYGYPLGGELVHDLVKDLYDEVKLSDISNISELANHNITSLKTWNFNLTILILFQLIVFLGTTLHMKKLEKPC